MTAMRQKWRKEREREVRIEERVNLESILLLWTVK